MKNTKLLILLVTLSSFLVSGWAQVPVLERKITLMLEDETLEVALKRISDAGRFTFSYSPSVLGDTRRKVNHRFVDRTVREVLDILFGASIQYKVRGNYVILTQSLEHASRRKDEVLVAGYVVDESTGQRLRDVSVYDPITLASTITDDFGYFEIKLDRPPGDVILSVNHQRYADTVVTVASRGGLLNVPLRLNREKVEAIADSVSLKLKRLWSGKRSPSQLHRLNVRDTLYRTAQVSFVPYIGTNHKMSGHVINDYSFNIIGGYSLGVRLLEVGGVFNIVRGDVSGAQFAGVFNAVGGEVDGVQFAGVFNANGKDTRGAHFAGVLNLHRREARGTLVAGVGNITGGDQGPAVAGVMNVAGRGARVQVGGVMNVAVDTVKGSQIAGVLNVGAREVRGSQIAGVLNVARTVRGAQVGFLNVADSVAGVSVGFLSFVRTGYHKIEISADEIFYNNLALRTGTHGFYNILFAGAMPSTYGDDQTLWTFGYGVGTAPRLGRKFQLNFDLTSQQIVNGNRIDALDLINKAYVGVDWQLMRKFSIAVGATLNAHLTERDAETSPELFRDFVPDIFHERDIGRNHHLKMWVGGKVGIRFL